MAQPEKEPQKPKSLKDKMQRSMEDFKTGDKLDSLYAFARENTRDTVAYIILFAGILISLFNSFLGGFLIGLITGFYFTTEILAFYDNFHEFLEKYGVFKTFILGGAALGLFIALPSFFLGIAVAIGIGMLVGERKTEEPKEPEEKP